LLNNRLVGNEVHEQCCITRPLKPCTGLIDVLEEHHRRTISEQVEGSQQASTQHAFLTNKQARMQGSKQAIKHARKSASKQESSNQESKQVNK
jgi:hypothetical protein